MLLAVVKQRRQRGLPSVPTGEPRRGLVAAAAAATTTTTTTTNTGTNGRVAAVPEAFDAREGLGRVPRQTGLRQHGAIGFEHEPHDDEEEEDPSVLGDAAQPTRLPLEEARRHRPPMLVHHGAAGNGRRSSGLLAIEIHGDAAAALLR